MLTLYWDRIFMGVLKYLIWSNCHGWGHLNQKWSNERTWLTDRQTDTAFYSFPQTVQDKKYEILFLGIKIIEIELEILTSLSPKSKSPLACWGSGAWLAYRNKSGNSVVTNSQNRLNTKYRIYSVFDKCSNSEYRIHSVFENDRIPNSTIRRLLFE